MKKQTVVFLVLMLVAGMNGLTQAQVEFNVDTDQHLASYGSFSRLNAEHRTVVEFLYLTQKEQYCTANLGGDGNTEAVICVFDDPTKADTQHLYIFAGYSVRFPVYYNGDVVHVLFREQGLASLRPGKYMIQVLSDHRGISLLSAVTFSIGDDSPAESNDRPAENIRLATPTLGTNWQHAVKHKMSNGCEVGYALDDFDTPAIAVVFKEEKTIRAIQSHALYSDRQSALVPDAEEEDDWQGFDAFITVYLNPTHQGDYRLEFEHAGRLYEVTFEYEAGITGARKVLAGIVIEC